MNSELVLNEYMPIAVRGWTGKRKKPSKRKRKKPTPISRMLVIDTETTIDAEQALTFGSAQLIDINWHKRNADETQTSYQASKQGEWFFYADELPQTDPAGYATLVAYCDDNSVNLISRDDFVEKVFRNNCERRKSPSGSWLGTATAVFFNAPFDLSRLAEYAGDGRGSNAGAFSFRMSPLYEGKENHYRRRIIIRHLDSKKSIISFGGTSGDKNRSKESGQGSFLDLRQLIWGLTNEATSLSRACDLFDVADDKHKTTTEEHGKITEDYIRYNRRDVDATAEVALKVLSDFYRHPIDIAATSVFSPASVAKAYLRKMGITPMLDRSRFPTDPIFLGHSISTFYGGRAECHIRHTPVPVQVCDFTSMYPTVNSLMRLWDYITAESVRTVDATKAVQAMLNGLTLEGLLTPETWTNFVGMVQIIPDGDILPVRAAYGDSTPGSYNVGINRLHSTDPLWYTIPDVVASTLLTGKAPKILKALRLVASSKKLSSLSTVKLLGTVDIYPDRDDFFKTVIERRQVLKREGKGHPANHSCGRCRSERFLKVLANSGSYGVYVEMLRTDDKTARTASVYGAYDQPWDAEITAEEEAQEFCYPPIGATITGAARLMLAIVEKLVTNAEGSWLFCDTDSMAIVADADGSLIPCDGGQHVMSDGRQAVKALTFKQVDEVRAQMNRLNPYDRTIVPEVLKVEATSWGFMISSKRYVLFNYVAGRPVVPFDIDGKQAFSEHGLGAYMNPGTAGSGRKDWIVELWQYLLDQAHNLNPEPPSWFVKPAMSQVTVSSPFIMRTFRKLNATRSGYREQIKPFNFILLTTEAASFGPDGSGAKRRLVAPFDSSSDSWADENTIWRNVYEPAEEATPGSKVAFKPMWRIAGEYQAHPEIKSNGPNGRPCGFDSRGVLSRRTVRPLATRHIGKESNNVEDVKMRIYRSGDDVLTQYLRFERGPSSDIIGSYSNREFARLVNAESDEIRAVIKRAQDDAASVIRRKLARQPKMTIEAEIQSESQKIQSDEEGKLGIAVRIDHKVVARFIAGQYVSRTVADAIERTSAKLVAGTIGITPSSIRARPSFGLNSPVKPAVALTMWVEAGGPSPIADQLCVCGCGESVSGRSRYNSDTCRRRYNRAMADSKDQS